MQELCNLDREVVVKIHHPIIPYSGWHERHFRLARTALSGGANVTVGWHERHFQKDGWHEWHFLPRIWVDALDICRYLEIVMILGLVYEGYLSVQTGIMKRKGSLICGR
jgi:hypothetical protein